MRTLACRYTLSGQLTTNSPLHIGGWAPGGDVDLEQVRDGRGRVVLPGTSLAGALRAALREPEAESGTGAFEEWWGEPLAGSRDEKKTSLITVSDATVRDEPQLEVRQGVSIDRFTGTAALRHLFSRRVIPAGTVFDFSLTIEVPTKDRDSAALNQIKSIATLLTGPGLTVGAATTSGLGAIRLDAAHLWREDFSSKTGLLEALIGGGRCLDTELSKVTGAMLPPGTLRITIPWRPLGPVMSRVADFEGTSTALPAVSRSHSGIHLLIPGASLKGILRSHAERILRTLRNSPLPTDADFKTQMALSAELPTIGETFGAAGDLANKQSGRKGLLTVSDSTSSAELPADKWIPVRDGIPAGLDDNQRRRNYAHAVDALNDAVADQGLWFDVVSRNAIDRWTGGAAEHLLYTSVEPYALGDRPERTWTPITLDLDVGRARRSRISVDALVALVLFLLRDLAEGWIPIGFGTTRGLGAVRADPQDIRFETNCVKTPSDQVADLDGKSLDEILTAGPIRDAIKQAWKEVTSCAPTKVSAS